jgi:hypothetical protein
MHAEAHLGTPSHYQIPWLSRLFSKLRLKRKDFQEVARLAWAQEVPSSNLGAPTTYFFVFNALFLILRRWKSNLGPTWVQVRVSQRFQLRDVVLRESRADKFHA